MYGRSHEFEGRISGFTMGTGSTLAPLPAENATGNFIKVVQRLPVRIDPINYDPDKLPLFIGLSVVPYVSVREEPTGPDAGKFLQPYLPLPKVASQANGPANQTGSELNEMGVRKSETGSALLKDMKADKTKSIEPQTATVGSEKIFAGRFFEVQAMSTAAISLPATRRTINPWRVAAAVVIPTFMEVLDTTIANVALCYIAGGLSAAVVDSEWVITSYLAANAVILPISGWISARLADAIISCCRLSFLPSRACSAG